MLETLIISGSIILSGILVSRSIAGLSYVEVPDQSEKVPDQPQKETFSDERIYGSDELHTKNEALDARMELLKQELLAEAQNAPGSVYPVDHSIVDSQYIRIPQEEYAK